MSGNQPSQVGGMIVGGEDMQPTSLGLVYYSCRWPVIDRPEVMAKNFVAQTRRREKGGGKLGFV